MTPLAHMLCSLVALSMSLQAAPTTIQCVSEAQRSEALHEASAGWYNGYDDVAYVVIGLDPTYQAQVLEHELAHAWDLRHGTEHLGFPGFFSEHFTGFTLEEYARLQTLWRGHWPAGETFPDVTPTQEEWAQMDAAGWLLPQ